jgi:hypothetical protein
MSVEKYFQVHQGNVSKVETSNTPYFKQLLKDVNLREISIPALNLNYAIPVSERNRISRFENLPSYKYNGQDISMSSYNGFSFYNQTKNGLKTIQIEHCTCNLDVSSMKIIHSRNNTPEYSTITLSMKKNPLSLSQEDEYIASGTISFLHNCIHLVARFGHNGTLKEGNAEYSLRHAALSTMLDTVKNPYDGMFFNTKEKLAKSNLLEREDVILNNDAVNYILAQELGIYPDTKINYEKTIDNLIINRDASEWEKLLSIEKVK